MKKFEWHKVASLTQDGSKYSHYMSSLQDVLQENGIDFVINRKYQRDTVDMSLVRLSFRLYNFAMDISKKTIHIVFVCRERDSGNIILNIHVEIGSIGKFLFRVDPRS